MISRIDYKGSVISISRLSGCDLRGADLTDTRFLGTNVFISSFAHAKLDRAVFVGAQIAHCTFESASMNQADFRETKLNTVEMTQDQIDSSRFKNKRAIKNVISSTTRSTMMINVDNFFER
ncbi:pentapeptide repeat-containing protein [Mesorhizobium sp. ESP7-2]|nr:pentapeptide repeat-containing protein [Mesorhizobium sp. ESP7-2]